MVGAQVAAVRFATRKCLRINNLRDQGEDDGQVSVWLRKQLPLLLLDSERRTSAAAQQKIHSKSLFFDSQGGLVSVPTGELSNATLSERLDDVVQRP
jgi:hypothetical protein